MSNVVSLNRHHETHVGRTLSKLSDMHRRGKIKGMMFVIAGRTGDHGGICGSFRDRPDLAVDCAGKAMTKLFTYAARKRMDPMTATDFFAGGGEG